MLPSKTHIRPQVFLFLLAFVFLFSGNLICQEKGDQHSPDMIMKSAYADVWLPFMESYRELNTEKFKSIQAEHLTKVAIDRNLIQPTSQYYQEIEGFFNQIKQANRQMDIKFSILSSAIGEDKIYQTGYYCISMRTSEKENFSPMGYGYFTVILKKVDGRWKISMDADKRAAIDEAEFRKSDLIYELK